MSVETALEVFMLDVLQAVRTDVITTIVLQMYTFLQQNRPETLVCPVDIAVHQSTSIFSLVTNVPIK